MNRLSTLTVAFVVTLAAVVGGAAVVGFATADGAAPAPAIQNDHFTDDDLIVNGTPGQATVEMDASAASQTVLVDPGVEAGGAGPAFPISLIGLGGGGVADRDIRPLANALIENGHDVGVYVPDPTQRRPAQAGADAPTQLGERLAEADAFVTFRTDYDPKQLDEIESFVESGGRVVLATEPDAAYAQPGAASLDATLDVTTEPGYVYNMDENDLNYQRVYAEAAGEATLTEGVDRAVFPSATPVGTGAGGTDVLRPIEGSELSATRAATDAPLLVRNDEVVMVGDSDFLSPENAKRADNDVLIGNLADFLVTDGGSPPAAGGSQSPEQPPTNGTAGSQGSTQPPANGTADSPSPDQPPANDTAG